MTTRLFGVASLEYLVHPNQIVLQLAAEIRDVLLPFEVREEAVKEEEPSFRAWDWATQTGQIMHLPEHPGERRLAALVGAGNDEDALRAGQKEIVGHYGSPFADELAREREVECLAAVNLLRRMRELVVGRSSGRHAGICRYT